MISFMGRDTDVGWSDHPPTSSDKLSDVWWYLVPIPLMVAGAVAGAVSEPTTAGLILLVLVVSVGVGAELLIWRRLRRRWAGELPPRFLDRLAARSPTHRALALILAILLLVVGATLKVRDDEYAVTWGGALVWGVAIVAGYAAVLGLIGGVVALVDRRRRSPDDAWHALRRRAP